MTSAQSMSEVSTKTFLSRKAAASRPWYSVGMPMRTCEMWRSSMPRSFHGSLNMCPLYQAQGPSAAVPQKRTCSGSGNGVPLIQQGKGSAARGSRRAAGRTRAALVRQLERGDGSFEADVAGPVRVKQRRAKDDRGADEGDLLERVGHAP